MEEHLAKRGTVVSFHGLRGIAAVLIFISHCSHLWNVDGNRLTWLGGFGVSLFMIMSGFLMGWHYLDIGREIPETMKLKPMLWKNMECGGGVNTVPSLGVVPLLKSRVKKFYALHLLMMLLAIPLSIGGKVIVLVAKLLMNAVLIQSWTPWSYFSLNGVAWYLSEFVFFTAMTPLILRFYQKKIKQKPLLHLILLFALQIIWGFLAGRLPYAHWLVYAFPPVRLADFLIGVELFLLSRKQCSFSPDVIFCGGFILSVFVCVQSFFNGSRILWGSGEFFSVAVWTVPSCVLLFSAVAGDKKSRTISFVLKNRVLLFLGNISLDFLLIHQIIIRYLYIIAEKIPKTGDFLKIYVLAFLLSVGAALLWQKIRRK